MKGDKKDVGYTEADAWMFETMLDEKYWDNYALGVQYQLYSKLLAFERRAKANLLRASIIGFDKYYEMISRANAIVGYNIDELERSMSANEYSITEQFFGTEPYYLN